MSIDFKMWHSIFDTFNNSVAHDKESFKKDYNRFVLKQDKLSILAEKAKVEGMLDKFLSRCDAEVNDGIDAGTRHHKWLSTDIENAYLLENLKAKFNDNNSFDDVAEKAHYYSHLDFVNDGKIKETFGPVRKRLNVPDEEDSDSNDFDFGSSK